MLENGLIKTEEKDPTPIDIMLRDIKFIKNPMECEEKEEDGKKEKLWQT